MKVFSIFRAGEKFNLHTPDHDIIECNSYAHAVRVASVLVQMMRLMWWNEWTTVRPLYGRARYQRNAIVLPSPN